MKHLFKLAAAAALIGVAALPSQAQTNLVEELGFQLTVISQGPTITNGTTVIRDADFARIGTRDVINLLGAATTNDFSKSAHLLRVTPIIGGTNGPTITVVEDGSNVVDVSGFFALATDGSVVRNSFSNHGKVLDATRFGIRTVALKDQAGFPDLTSHFDLQGFDVSTYRRVSFKDKLTVGGHYATWTVNGTGDHNGKPLVIRGEVTVNFVTVNTTGGL